MNDEWVVMKLHLSVLSFFSLRLLPAAILSFLLFSPAHLFSQAGYTVERERNTAVTGKIGTLGPGVDVTVPFRERFNLRIAGHYLRFSYSDEVDDIDYDLDVRLASAGALLDWHPFDGAFRLSGGALYYGNRLRGEAEPEQEERIGDVLYGPDDVGTITADVDFNDIVPYLGIGWGNPLRWDRRWTFNFDLGVVYHGRPDVRLRADGDAADDPQFQEDLRREEENFRDDIGNYRFWPVVAVGLSYRF